MSAQFHMFSEHCIPVNYYHNVYFLYRELHKTCSMFIANSQKYSKICKNVIKKNIGIYRYIYICLCIYNHS